MLNAIPLLGWLMSFVFMASLSVPFWMVWTLAGIGEKFFYFLPTVYHNVGFWETVWLFIAVSIIKGMLTPRFNITIPPFKGGK